MHGREGENRKRSQHMWSVPTRGTAVTRISAGSFCKDGRKISIGDTALFKLLQDSPPFIGIIRWLASKKENNLHLGVNWLYRPAEVKLCKGILLDAPPNEVFYSFHKDEIPATLLLHPCKVAFLPKGVELPVGVSSFVCRRVYDIANKCLWWLTDQDYVDERQEEVDKLLHKRGIEMHPTVQPGGRSPKPIHGPTSTSQLKSGSDMQSSNPFASQAKGRKRDRSDQGTMPVKRERSSMTDDGDSTQFKPENTLKSEISKITENGGGLLDPEGTEKLVQLMQPDRAERKMELISRSMLASVIAATEKFDCLSWFVQLKGLCVLDEWLQDAHKGKIGDGSPKDGDKSVEEFLLVLLRALDKLPVNLHALQMCNIGKSVNHLRSHKNLEIQRKARGLVDTWKKRVEAEMNVIDTKPGSNHTVSWSRSRLPEVSHDGNRNPGGSTEVAVKSSVTQLSASKTASVKPVESEFSVKSTSSSPGATKSAVSPAPGKESHARVVVGCTTSDLPSATAREDRSSSSSQSHNNSQCLGNGKEDPKSSTAGSMTASKVSGGSSRHRRSINGFSGPAVSGGQRETGPSRNSSVQRSSASDKLTVSGFTCEKALDVTNVEGNGHKLIVKIPNRGRSPGRSAGGGSVDQPSNMNSRASSPMLSEKHDQSDRISKEKIDADRANTTYDVNTESWQSNDVKDLLTGSDEGDGSPAAIPEEVRRNVGEDAVKSKFDFDSLLKLAEVSRAASSSSGNELKAGKSHVSSFSAINALVERCVKYSEANASVSAGDDVRMNLLASVAAGEMSRSDLISLADSPCRNTPMVEDSSMGDDAKSKFSHGNNVDQERSWSADGAQQLIKQASGSISGDGKANFSTLEHAPTGEGNEYHSSDSDLQIASEPSLEMNERFDELRAAAAVAVSLASAGEMVLVGEERKLNHEATVNSASANDIQDTKAKGSCYLSSDDKVSDVPPSVEVEKKALEGLSSNASLDMGTENKNSGHEGFDGGDPTERVPSPGKVQSEHLERSDEDRLHNCVLSKDLPSENVEELNGGKDDEMDPRSNVRQVGRQISDYGINSGPSNENQVLAGLGSAVSDQKIEGREANVVSKDVLEHCSGGAVPRKGSPALPTTELEHHVMSRGSKMSGVEADETEESASTAAVSSSFNIAEASNMGTKLKFDLNEGFVADEGKCGEPINLAGPGSSASVHLNVFPFPVPSVSSSFPASITVAAAAKGPFVPREELLRSKGEVGWKGSAATSAFRPAEPRKGLEMPLGTAKTHLPDSTAGRHGRPVLDIDLNVPDERILEDMTCRNSDQETASTSDHVTNRDLVQTRALGSAPIRSSGGLILDLNLADEASDMGQYQTRSIRTIEAPLVPLKSSSTGGFLKSEVRRDFDLNNGPVVDEANAEPFLFSQHGRSIMQSQPPVAGLRMNNAEMGTFSPWYPAGNSYPGVRFPSTLSDRGEHPFPIVAGGGPPRMLGPPTGGTPFTSDVYRGASMLSSSPAVPFSYPVFPFGSSFPLPSATFSGGSTTYMDSSSGSRLSFPNVNSQSLGPASTVASQYPRPYVVSLPDGSSDIGIDNSRKWMRQGLDLNSGPGNVDVEGRDETLALGSRQLSVARSPALAEEQARMYQQVAGGVLKRKEPEGWDSENLRYKQSSWQ